MEAAAFPWLEAVLAINSAIFLLHAWLDSRQRQASLKRATARCSPCRQWLLVSREAFSVQPRARKGTIGLPCHLSEPAHDVPPPGHVPFSPRLPTLPS